MSEFSYFRNENRKVIKITENFIHRNFSWQFFLFGYNGYFELYKHDSICISLCFCYELYFTLYIFIYYIFIFVFLQHITILQVFLKETFNKQQQTQTKISYSTFHKKRFKRNCSYHFHRKQNHSHRIIHTTYKKPTLTNTKQHISQFLYKKIKILYN